MSVNALKAIKVRSLLGRGTAQRGTTQDVTRLERNILWRESQIEARFRDELEDGERACFYEIRQQRSMDTSEENEPLLWRLRDVENGCCAEDGCCYCCVRFCESESCRRLSNECLCMILAIAWIGIIILLVAIARDI